MKVFLPEISAESEKLLLEFGLVGLQIFMLEELAFSNIYQVNQYNFIKKYQEILTLRKLQEIHITQKYLNVLHFSVIVSKSGKKNIYLVKFPKEKIAK